MAERTGDRGWYDFAGAMFGIAGAFNGIQGLSAIMKKEYFAGGSPVYDNLQFWGWAWLIIGVVQIAAAIMLFSGQGRMLGIVLAALSAVVSFTSLGAYPVWGIIVIAMDVLIIHGLTHPTVMGSSSSGTGGAPRPEIAPPPMRGNR
jgi:hypothetical protein